MQPRIKNSLIIHLRPISIQVKTTTNRLSGFSNSPITINLRKNDSNYCCNNIVLHILSPMLLHYLHTFDQVCLFARRSKSILDLISTKNLFHKNLQNFAKLATFGIIFCEKSQDLAFLWKICNFCRKFQNFANFANCCKFYQT